MNAAHAKFEHFCGLHHAATPLLLGNAWDAMSAKLLEDAGFAAVGTTSAGVAASLGWPDNEQLPAEELCAAIDRMARVSTLPLSADIETGYFSDDKRFDALIVRLLDTGIVGVNLQDACGLDVSLIPASEICRRIDRLKTLALRRKQPVFINARSDVYWLDQYAHAPNAKDRALKRLLAYRDAGADGIFLPGLKDLETAREIADACALPLNLLACPTLPPLHELKAFGVSRLSLGSSLFRLLFSNFRRVAKRLAANPTFEWLDEIQLSYSELDSLYLPRTDMSTTSEGVQLSGQYERAPTMCAWGGGSI